MCYVHHQGPETIQVGADHFRSTSNKLWVVVSAVPVPCPRRLCLKLKGKQGSGSEGVGDLLGVGEMHLSQQIKLQVKEMS